MTMNLPSVTPPSIPVITSTPKAPLLLRAFGARAGTSVETPIDPVRAKQAMYVGGAALGVGIVATIFSKWRGGSTTTTVSKSGVTVLITIAPISVAPGSSFVATVTVTSKTVIKDGQVKITWTLPSGVLTNGFALTTGMVNTKPFTFNVPANLDAGTYSIQASVLSGNTEVGKGVGNIIVTSLPSPVITPGNTATQGSTLVPIPPTDVSPNGQVYTQWTGSIPLSWTNFPGAMWNKIDIVAVNAPIERAPGLTIVIAATGKYNLQEPRIGSGQYILLPGTTYNFFVYASNRGQKPDANNQTDWSAPVSGEFTTPVADSNKIRAVQPSNGAKGVSGKNGYVQWSDGNPYVFMYEVQISADKAFAAGSIIDQNWHGGQSSPYNSYPFSKSPLADGGAYYWRVRPVSNPQADWSSTFQFSTSGTAAPVDPSSGDNGQNGGNGSGSSGAPVNIAPNGYITATYDQYSDTITFSVTNLQGDYNEVVVYAAKSTDAYHIPGGGWTKVTSPFSVKGKGFTWISNGVPTTVVYLAAVMKKNGVEVATGVSGNPGWLRSLVTQVTLVPPTPAGSGNTGTPPAAQPSPGSYGIGGSPGTPAGTGGGPLGWPGYDPNQVGTIAQQWEAWKAAHPEPAPQLPSNGNGPTGTGATTKIGNDYPDKVQYLVDMVARFGTRGTYDGYAHNIQYLNNKQIDDVYTANTDEGKLERLDYWIGGGQHQDDASKLKYLVQW